MAAKIQTIVKVPLQDASTCKLAFFGVEEVVHHCVASLWELYYASSIIGLEIQRCMYSGTRFSHVAIKVGFGRIEKEMKSAINNWNARRTPRLHTLAT